MTDMNAAVILALKDKLSGPMKKIIGSVKQLKKEMSGLNKSTGAAQETKRIQSLQRAYKNLGQAMHTVKKEAGGLFKRGGVIASGLIAAKVAVAGFGLPFLQTAAKFEQFNLRLRSATTSSAEAQQAMAWIMNFEAKTPFNLEEVTSAYISLRQQGIDPMAGAFKAAGDAAAANGTDLMASVEAIKDAMTGENERLKQYGITASQNSKKGTVDYFWVDKSGKQKKFTANLRDQKQLVETISMIMTDKFGGATDELAKGWGGIMSSIVSMRDKFELMTMNGGAFATLKQQLKDFLDQLSIWEKDGTMKSFADAIGSNITDVLNAVIPAVKGAWSGLKQLAKVVQRLSQIAGGYENLGYFAFGIYMLYKSMALVMAVKNVAGILGSIASLGGGGAALGLLKVAGGLGAIALALAAIQNYTPDMLNYLDSIDPAGPQPRDKKMQYDNPFAKNWAPVGQEVVNRAGDVAINYLKQQYAQMDAAYAVWNARLHDQLMGLGSQLKAAIAAGLSSLFDVGSQWIGSLLEGMKAKVGELIAWAGSVGSQISSALNAGAPAGAVIAGGHGGVQRGPRPSSFKAPSNGGPRALGGSVYKGGTHLVGERGPELMTAKRFGHVTPLSKLNGNTGPTIHMGGITIHGDANERTLSKLADMLAARLRSGLHDGAYA
jgi:Tape measure protein